MLHKKKIEKQITNEVINDLFEIFVKSETKQDFIFQMQKEGYKNAETVWDIFYPEYDKYRQENLQKLK